MFKLDPGCRDLVQAVGGSVVHVSEGSVWWEAPFGSEELRDFGGVALLAGVFELVAILLLDRVPLWAPDGHILAHPGLDL